MGWKMGGFFHGGLNWGCFNQFSTDRWNAAEVTWNIMRNDVKNQFLDTPRLKTMLQSYLLIPWTTNPIKSSVLKHTGLFCMANLVGSCCKFPRMTVFLSGLSKRSERDTPYFLKVLKLLFWCVSSGGDEFGGYEHFSAHLCGIFWR